MRYLFVVPSITVLLIALIVRPEWIFMLIFTVFMLIALLAGVYLFITARINETPKPSPQISNDLELLRKYLTELDSKPSKPKRLPAVFGRMLDDALQQLIDLILQEIIGKWLESSKLNSEEILISIKEDVWKMVQSFQERLSHVDLVKLVAIKMVTKVTQHFEHIRISCSPRHKDIKISKPAHLKNMEAELNYLRKVAELVLTSLLPEPYLKLAPVTLFLKEIFVYKVLYSAIETFTDPDYINQKILLYVHKPARNDFQRHGAYNYAASFEDFIQTIKDCNDAEVLTQIRNSIINEIMSATIVQSKKKHHKNTTVGTEVFEHGIEQGDLVQGQQVNRFIHQLTYARSLCEKQLMHLGWAGCAVEEAVEATALSGKKILQLDTLLESVVCKPFLSEFLEQSGDKQLLKCWEAIEELRNADQCDWHQLATDLFYTFFNTPSPVITIDKPTLKRMEQFLLGNQGPEIFYEVQAKIVLLLEEKVYPAFLLTDVYQRMESAVEQVIEAEPAEEACLQEAESFSNKNSVGDGSNYAHRKLDEIQRKLNNKTQALQALRCNMKPDHSVLSLLESDVEALQGEKRQLEAHLMRTEAWSEHLGCWRAVVQSAEVTEDKESLQFVLVVHILEDESDSEAISTGWVVLRRLTEFQELHRKLCQLSPCMKQLDLPSPSLKFRFGKVALERALEKAKSQIQKYLKFVLEDDTLNKSEAVYAFLSPSSEHLKQTTPSPQKPKFAFSTLFKNPLQLVEGLSGSSYAIPPPGVSDAEEESVLLLDENGHMLSSGDQSGKDGIAEPLYDLLGEIFDLRGVFMWLRKTLITFVQITYNKTISRQVRETVTGLFTEHMVYSYIQFIIKSWFTNGKLRDPPPPRTEEQKEATVREARNHFLANIPDLLTHLVGQQASKRGATKVFDILQDRSLNKCIFYDLLEIVLHDLFPEWVN